MLVIHFLLQYVKQEFTVFLCFKKSDALYLFSTNWLLLLIIDKFTITEFAILIRNLSFLVPPSTLGEHIYRVSVILRKDIFQISTGWLPLLLLFWFTYLYHRYSGEAFSQSLKEAVEDRRKRGKTYRMIRQLYAVGIVFDGKKKEICSMR